MSAVCGQHRQPAQLVVTYYQPIGDRFIRLDQLACNEGCGDPLLAGLDRSWFAMKVRNRLAALERRGVLQVTKEDGRNQLWHWPVSR